MTSERDMDAALAADEAQAGPGLGIEGQRTPRERVLEAAIALVDCDDADGEEYRRVWERFRRAALAWLECTAGGRGAVRATYRPGTMVVRRTAKRRVR